MAKEIDDTSDWSNNKHFDVFCQLCKPTVVKLSVSTKSSWNLKRHVLTSHSALNAEISDYVNRYKENAKESAKRKNNEGIDSNPKQQKLDGAFKKVNQNGLNKLLVDLICDGMLSFSILDNKSMRKLLEAGFPGKTILSRRSVVPLIENDFQQLISDVKQELQQQKYVCLTCDSWTSYRRYESIR